ncbi:hypothetical protein ACOJQI_11760 [Bacillus salacetis]|uniref:hypothetical protein n=1 Tax=Bacillus salacetis TaxID=2315464 RepID=UPI003B9FB451
MNNEKTIKMILVIKVIIDTLLPKPVSLLAPNKPAPKPIIAVIGANRIKFTIAPKPLLENKDTKNTINSMTKTNRTTAASLAVNVLKILSPFSYPTFRRRLLTKCFEKGHLIYSINPNKEGQ